ncbi:hypothetical protein GGR53DRAFT_502023 [Hypoxylon sp. FL1150]|nr:hypothetical protein GGR53DRAFT_502023 [Hypoxylon sp. FL1150]
MRWFIPYFMADVERTINRGLSHKPTAFENIVKERILFTSEVHGVTQNECNKTLTVSYRPTGSNPREVQSSTEQFDYVFNTVPFTLLLPLVGHQRHRLRRHASVVHLVVRRHRRMSDEHVAYAQRVNVEIHGEAAEENWTGNG